MKRRRKSLILGIFLLLCGLGIGYAFLNTSLSINGTTDVDANTWNVYWDNVVVTSGSVEANTPTIDTNKTSVSFNVHLSKPGDFYEFTVDAKNDGSIDAMIDEITKTTNIPTYINYMVIYSDGIEIIENQLLTANTKEVYKVRVEYRTDINPSDLPSTPQSISLSFGVTYVQADSNAIEKPVYVYMVNTKTYPYTYIEQAIPTGVPQYNNPEEAILALRNEANNNSINFCLKHRIKDGVVVESYIVFILTPEMAATNPGVIPGTYSLKGSGGTYNSSTGDYNPDSPYFESNKSILLTFFGSTNCVDSTSLFRCSAANFSAYASSSGRVIAMGSGGWRCDVFPNGSSYCYNEWN